MPSAQHIMDWPIERESGPSIRGEAEKKEVSCNLDEMPKEFTDRMDAAMDKIGKAHEIKDPLEKRLDVKVLMLR